MKIILSLLVSILFLSTPLFAKDMDGEFAVFGVGADSCQQYLDSRKPGGEKAYEYQVWMQAYFSAFNLIVSKTYNIIGTTPMSGMLDWLDDHCGYKPNELFVNAVAALTTRLYPGRMNIAPNKDTAGKWNKTFGSDK